MEKRLFIALVLMTLSLVVTQILFPPPPKQPAAVPGAVATQQGVAAPVRPRLPVAAPAVPADSVVVASPLFRYVFSTRGAGLARAELREYPSFSAGIAGRPVQLVLPGGRTLTHRLVVGGDTVDLSALPFTPSTRAVQLAADQTGVVRWSFSAPNGIGADLEYTFRGDDYGIAIRGRVRGVAAAGTALVTELGPGLAAHERDAERHIREVGLVARSRDDVERIGLRKLDEAEALDGPLTWAAVRDPYFVIGALATGAGSEFSKVAVRPMRSLAITTAGGKRRALPRASVATTLPLRSDGTFALRAYVGPQEYRRMAALGEDFEEVTPYGYAWLRPVVRPIAAVVVWLLDRMHTGFDLAYGWVLILFGILVRVVTWPLNSRASRAQMRNMAVQPLMQEIQKKYADDPARQQQEMVRLYKEHGFNPLAGCLPMLVPMPVLITLFFVFQNSIAFRGTSFWWLRDLSLPDPLYLLPVFLLISMFALQWISTNLSGIEQTPQTRMMTTIMPLIFGTFFFTLPSGLNLYYAANNLASLPQQIMLALERRRAQDALNAAKGGAGGASPSAAVRPKSPVKLPPGSTASNRAARRHKGG